MLIPTQEELAAAKAQFQKDHVTLEALPILDGRQFASVVQIAGQISLSLHLVCLLK